MAKRNLSRSPPKKKRKTTESRIETARQQLESLMITKRKSVPTTRQQIDTLLTTQYSPKKMAAIKRIAKKTTVEDLPIDVTRTIMEKYLSPDDIDRFNFALRKTGKQAISSAIIARKKYYRIRPVLDDHQIYLDIYVNDTLISQIYLGMIWKNDDGSFELCEDDRCDENCRYTIEKLNRLENFIQSLKTHVLTSTAFYFCNRKQFVYFGIKNNPPEFIITTAKRDIQIKISLADPIQVETVMEDLRYLKQILASFLSSSSI